MAYALAIVHLENRRALISPATLNPTGYWMQQQTRNVLMWAEEQSIDVQFLIHDRDARFTDAFDQAFKRDNGGVVKTPILAPSPTATRNRGSAASSVSA